jgi:hypothetical protein
MSGQRAGAHCPVEWVGVGGHGGAEADLDAGPDWEISWGYIDDSRRAVALRAQHKALVAGDHHQRPFGRQHGPCDDP